MLVKPSRSLNRESHKELLIKKSLAIGVIKKACFREKARSENYKKNKTR